MKIAIIAPEFVPALGGAGIYAKNLVKELSKDASLDIHVITPLRDEKADLTDFKNITIHNISKADDTFFYNFVFQIAIAKKFKELHKKYNFDLVHSTGLVHMPDIFLDYNSINIPHLVTVHTTIETQFDYKTHNFTMNFSPVELLSKLSYPYIKFMQVNYIRKTKNFICVSNYVKKFLPDNKKIRIIKNGITTECFINPDKKDFLFLKKIKKPKILFCGRLLYMKGLATIIESANFLKNKAHFVVAGDGSIKKWEKMAKSQNITFLGKVDHKKIAGLYNECDIFILPSFIESFPLSILEAMSSGLPVIAGNVGGIPELIKHEENGILFSPGNAVELTNNILNLIKDKEKRKDLGKKARETALKHYDSSLMARRTISFYKEIVGDRNSC